MSLEESKRSRKPEVITIDSDDDDGDIEEETQYQANLRRALEASKAEIRATRSTQPPSVPSPKTEAPKPGPSLFLSERAKLEKERLERQKRMRKEAGLDDKEEKPDTESDTESDVSMAEPPMKRQHLSTSSQDKSIPAATSGAPGLSGSENFWDGELRQTATRFADPRRDGRPTFRLTQVLGDVGEAPSFVTFLRL